MVYLGRGAAYHLLPPEGRAGYLEWLARGRSETKAPQHYLFLFFCGMMVLQLIWVKWMVPETKGVPLEQMQKKLGIE